MKTKQATGTGMHKLSLIVSCPVHPVFLSDRIESNQKKDQKRPSFRIRADQSPKKDRTANGERRTNQKICSLQAVCLFAVKNNGCKEIYNSQF